jgi:ClpP class serine protease
MWLLAAAVRQAIEQAHRNGVIPSAEQQAQYEARYGDYESDTSRVMVVAGDVAEIKVSGVITKAPSLLAMLFGGGNVTYSEIIQALAEAQADPAVKRAEMKIDSPGGSIDGLFDAIAAMQAFNKPLKAVVHNQAASAAYSLAAQADEIVAANRATRFGSIGIVGSFRVDENTVDITSTKAPKKRPDVTTEAGQAMVREELDALHEIFVDSIATGRDTTAEKINAEYGQGATLLAGEALKRGMIDSIAEQPLRVVGSSTSTTSARSGGGNPEIGPMDLNTLRAQHPDVFAAAVQQGVDQERDRVSAHLTMGNASGDMETALKAVKEGSAMTATLQATYLAAGMNRRDQENRQDDDTAASGADGASNSAEGQDAADLVCGAVESALGIVGENDRA